MASRVNIGCGQTPTKGWIDLDNSLSLRLAWIPVLPDMLRKAGLLDASQYSFICFARQHDIRYGDATRGLPMGDQTADVVYSSHMLEHPDRGEAAIFLRETFRILAPGGIIRIAVPDLGKHVRHYLESSDADIFIESMLLCVPRPRSIVQGLRALLIGARHHQWMYDGASLAKLLQSHGFVRADVMRPGETRIRNHEPLDLREKHTESVYVEAEKPNV